MAPSSHFKTVPELLDYLSTARGREIAISSPGYTPLDYRQLTQLAQHCTHVLASGGLDRSSRVALALAQSPAALTACLGISCYCTAVPLNPDYTLQEFGEYLLRSRVDALVVTAGMSHPASTAAAQLGLPVIHLGPSASDTCGLFVLEWQESVDCNPPNDCGLPAADDIALLLHTSGSTAKPKLVPLTHSMLCQSARNVARSLALDSSDICLSMMPQFHIGALVDLLLAPILGGGKVVVAPDISPATFFECLDEFKPTWFQATPTLLKNILVHASRNEHLAVDPALRLIRSVSAPLPSDILIQSEKLFGTAVIEIYGMTETAGVITSNPLAASARKPGSVGISAGPELCVLDAEGGIVQSGRRGQIAVRGSTVMTGYERGSGDRATTVNEEWFATGDEGYLDSEGYLFLTGRMRDIINRGGEKISPAEIDAQLLLHPAVADAAAFAVPHDSLGEDVAAAVVVREGCTLQSNDISGFLRSSLAPHKIPRRFFVTTSLPRNSTGKLMRGRIIEQQGGVAAVTGRPGYSAPQNRLEQDIAALWERALGSNNIGTEDDFFELGGDSLSATTFIVDLQEQLMLYADAADLLDHPTLGAFCAHLKTRPAPARSGPDEPAETLAPVIQRELLALTSSWPGERANADSLLVGRNLSGTDRPLFWCVQANLELNKLQNHLGENQPLYGMRTLFRTRSKTEANSRRLASHYRREIEALYPQGPVRIGGFCAGARIAFQVARELQHKGRHVELLCLQDQAVHEPYQGRVALFFSRPCIHNQLDWFHQPERGWSKCYGEGVSIHHCDAEHRFYYREPWIQQMVEQLRSELDKAAMPHAVNDSELQKLPTSAYRARIECSAIPAELNAGTRLELAIKVTNIGDTIWGPARESGLLLAARWLTAAGEPKGNDCGMAGHYSLPNALAPGSTMQLSLWVLAPNPSGKVRRTLDIDMVDDGICWFADKGSEPLRQGITLLPATAPKTGE